MASLASAAGTTTTSSDLKVTQVKQPMLNGVQHSRYEAQLAAAPGMYVRYETENDSFEAYDTRSMGEPGPSASDISLDAAKKIFADKLAQLQAAGLVSSKIVTGQEIQTHEVHCAEGSNQEGLRRDWIDEWVLFAPASIEGIHVGTLDQEFGVVANVHKSGRIRRIEIAGAAISADEPGVITVTGTAVAAKRPTPADQLAKAKLGAQALIKPSTRRYVTDDRGNGAAVPRELLTVNPAGTGADGATIYGKAYVVSYAIDNASDQIDVWPPVGDPGPNPSDKSTK
jgi:hypothetical protein